MRHRPASRRQFEVIMAVIVIVYGLRTAIPLTAAAVFGLWWRIPFGLLVLSPGVALLLWSHRPVVHRRALLGVAAAGLYATAGIIGTNWMLIGSAVTSLGMSCMAFILYGLARLEAREHE